MVVKAFIILNVFLFALAPASASWFYGMPVTEACILYFAMLFVIGGSFFSRWNILKSGLIWSLMEPEVHKQSLKQFEAEVRALWVGLPVEGCLLSGLAVVLGAVVDVAGRVAEYGESCRNVFLVFMCFSVFNHCFVAGTTKLLPLIIRAVCSTLAEDLKHFHSAVEGSSQAAVTDTLAGAGRFLEDLQQHEVHLRTRFAAANKAIEPMVRWVLLSLFFVTFLSLILIVRTHRQGQQALVVALWAFIGLQHSFLLVSVLLSVARVGDMWNEVVEDVNTPVICSRTACVLSGVPLAQRLGELRCMGIVLNGHTIYSSTVSSLIFTLSSGLFLALWAVMTDS